MIQAQRGAHKALRCCSCRGSVSVAAASRTSRPYGRGSGLSSTTTLELLFCKLTCSILEVGGDGNLLEVASSPKRTSNCSIVPFGRGSRSRTSLTRTARSPLEDAPHESSHSMMRHEETKKTAGWLLAKAWTDDRHGSLLVFSQTLCYPRGGRAERSRAGRPCAPLSCVIDPLAVVGIELNRPCVRIDVEILLGQRRRSCTWSCKQVIVYFRCRPLWKCRFGLSSSTHRI